MQTSNQGSNLRGRSHAGHGNKGLVLHVKVSGAKAIAESRMRPVLVAMTVAVTAGSGPAHAQSSLAGATFHIARADRPIRVDGVLDDEGWRNATRVETWYEVTPGDNVDPPVKCIGYLTFDDRFLYIGLDFQDPDPSAIRAPLGDHDAINGASMDFGGIFLDPLNTGRRAVEFFVSPANVQYDAVTDDASGENSAPDCFWDSATRITSTGWTAEIRIPFSSLRYKKADPQTCGFRADLGFIPQVGYREGRATSDGPSIRRVSCGRSGRS